MERDAKLIPVREFMNPRVTSLPADLPIEDALEVLVRSGFSGAPVVEGDRVLGVLSEVDCARVLSTAAFHATPTGYVRDWMTKDVDALTDDQDLFSASQRFLHGGHRRLPVVDGQGRLVGLVALRDLGKALRHVHRQRQQVVRPDAHPPGAAWDPRKTPKA